MASTRIGYMMFLIVALGIGCLFGVRVLVDIRNYRNLQRRLREERRRREETGSR
jgi:hypothetical protein